MALALYRRYRPGTFAELVGQDHVTEPLRTALGAGRINHAYLFSGPRGCGKTSSARILARSLNCEHGPTAEPCGECESCAALAPDGPGSLDVIEMDAASHGGVEDARDLRDRVQFAPVHSRYRVFIIDEAHMVTPQGFNALLKVVEEPPDHLVFVFATTEPEKVLATIRSRTHHYPFRLLPPSTLRGLLERVCEQESVPVEPAVYPLVVRAGGGSARDSLSVLDQLLAGADEGGITYARAVGLLGVTDVALLDDLVDALGAQDGPGVFGAVDRLVEAGHDPRRFAADLLQRLRDLVLVQAVPDAGEKGLVDVPADELERMTDQAARLGPAALARYAELVHTALTEMRGATAPRLLLELVCARMLLPAATSSDAAMVQRLEGVERRLTLGGAPDSGDGAARRFSRPSERAAGGPPDAGGGGGAGGGGAGAATGAAVGAGTAAGVAPEEASSREPTPGGTTSGQPGSRTTASAPTEPAGAQGTGPSGEPADPQGSARTGDEADPAPAATVEAPTDRSTAVVGGDDEPAHRDEAPAATDAEPAARPAGGRSGPGRLDAAALRQVWPEVMTRVREANKPTHALLMNATVSAVDGATVTLAMPTPPLARQMSQPNRCDHVARALGVVFSGEWTVRAVAADDQGAGTNRGGRGAGAAPTGGSAGARGRPERGNDRGRPSSGEGRGEQRSGAGDAGAAGSSGDSRPGGSAGAAPEGGSGSPASRDRPPPPGRRGDPSVDRPGRERAPGRPRDDVPPPPEPPEEEVTEDDMYAQARDEAPQSRRDPEEAAMELLTQQLGARRVDER